MGAIRRFLNIERVPVSTDIPAKPADCVCDPFVSHTAEGIWVITHVPPCPVGMDAPMKRYSEYEDTGWVELFSGGRWPAR